MTLTLILVLGSLAEPWAQPAPDLAWHEAQGWWTAAGNAHTQRLRVGAAIPRVLVTDRLWIDVHVSVIVTDSDPRPLAVHGVMARLAGGTVQTRTVSGPSAEVWETWSWPFELDAGDVSEGWHDLTLVVLASDGERYRVARLDVPVRAGPGEDAGPRRAARAAAWLLPLDGPVSALELVAPRDDPERRTGVAVPVEALAAIETAPSAAAVGVSRRWSWRTGTSRPETPATFLLSFDPDGPDGPGIGDVHVHEWPVPDPTIDLVVPVPPTTHRVLGRVTERGRWGDVAAALVFDLDDPGRSMLRADAARPRRRNRRPNAVIGATTHGLEVALTAADSSDPDGDPLTYAWKLGDGRTSKDPELTHSYASAGTYDIRLVVSDGGGRDRARSIVTVASTGPPAEPMPSSEHAIALTTPTCDPSHDDVRIIDSPDDWADINDRAYRVFCVMPGDYTSVGSIRLVADGGDGNPRWIRYLDPVNRSAMAHPVHRGGDQAVVAGFVFDDASHWVVQGLTQRGDWTMTAFERGSTHNVLDRLLVERSRVWFRHGAHENTLQNSVVRGAPLVPGSDRVCVLLEGDNDGDAARIEGTRIVNNEIYDCTDAVQLYRRTGSTYPVAFDGTIIDHNDLYLTPERYSDCDGTLDPTGSCACAENAIDVKAGGTGPTAIVRITNNRMWGFRQTDPACGGSGSWGDAVTTHGTADYSLYQGNRIWDSARGLNVDTGRTSIVDNVIHGISNPVARQGYGLMLGASRSEVYRNIISSVMNWTGVDGEDNDYRCNALIAAGGPHGRPRSVSADYNFYFDAEPLRSPGIHDIVEAAAADAHHTQLCLGVRRWTGPDQVCLPHSLVTSASPHVDACDANLGSEPGVGIDDARW